MAAKSKGMKAYVLIETAPGKTKAIRKALGSVTRGAVANLDAVTGPYDFIAVVEGPTLDAIGRLVTEEIGAINGVTRTTTCVAISVSRCGCSSWAAPSSSACISCAGCCATVTRSSC